MQHYTNLKKRICEKDHVSILASILALLVIPMIFLNLYGIRVVNNKLGTIIFLSLVLVIIVYYRLYRNVHILLLLSFMVWMGASAGFSGEKLTKAWGGAVPRAWIICLLGFVTAYLRALWKDAKWFRLLCLILTVSADVFFIMILRNAFGDLFSDSIESNMQIGLIHNGRLHGFGNANTIGAVAAITLIAGAILLIDNLFLRLDDIVSSTESPTKSKLGNTGIGRVFQIIYVIISVVSIILSVFILTLSRSRASILAAGVGVGLLVFYSMCLKKVERNAESFKLSSVTASVLAAVGSALIVVLISAAAKNLTDYVVKEVAAHTVSYEKSVEISETLVPYSYVYALDTLTDRTMIWPATINMLNEKPIRWLIGVTAPKSSTALINYIYEDRPELYAVFAHNGYLQNLLMYGLPGAALLLFILAIWCIHGIRVYFNSDQNTAYVGLLIPFAVAGILFGFVEVYPFPFWNLHPVAYMFFIVAGAACAVSEDKYAFVNSPAGSKKTINALSSGYYAGRANKIYVIFLLFICSASIVFNLTTNGLMKIQASEAAIHSNVAKTESEVFELLNKNISANLQNPEYWIDNCRNRGLNPEEILMSEAEIESFNYMNRKRLASMNICIALEDIGVKFNGKVLESFIKDSMGELDEKNTSDSKSEIDKVSLAYACQNMNLDSIGANVDVKFGYSVARTMLWRMPGLPESSFDGDESEYFYDTVTVAELMPNVQVAVLLTSEDDKWIYIFTEDYGGWVPREAVALCNNREEWLDIARNQRTDNHIVVSGKTLNVSVESHTLSLPMGTVVAAERATNATGEDGYLLQLPINIDGKLGFYNAFVPKDADVVYNAYLPYTQENLLKQAFKFLGDEYGWAGSRDSVDCSSFVKEVYASFGITMPGSPLAQASVANAKSRSFFIGMNDRLSHLEKVPAGALLYFPGHISVYLGTVDRVPYCISAVGSIETEDMSIGSSLVINRVIISDMLYTTRANGVSWLNSLECVTRLGR